MHLPQELGFGSGYTCWRRLDQWQRAGVWDKLHALLLSRLRLGWGDRVVACDHRLKPDPGEKGGSETGPSPVDRGRAGSKHHLLTDAGGIPLAWALTGGNRNDITQLLALVDRVPAVARPPWGVPAGGPAW